MDNKTFFTKVLKIVISWPVVTLILGLNVANLFLIQKVKLKTINVTSDINTILSIITALGTLIAALAASMAAYFAFKAWRFEKLPVVHAIGSFIISTKQETNTFRDNQVNKSGSLHTLQLVNVGRGSAQNVIPSVGKERDQQGRFLEDINPHSFSLPSNQGTKVLNETLRVHGQIFVQGNNDQLDFEHGRTTGHFYIRFEDYMNKAYLTKVKIIKVSQVDDKELNNRIKDNNGIQVWKVIENIKEEI